jgi:hypothetical protein
MLSICSGHAAVNVALHCQTYEHQAIHADAELSTAIATWWQLIKLADARMHHMYWPKNSTCVCATYNRQLQTTTHALYS